MASPVTVGRVEMETFNALMGHAQDITPHATMNRDKWPLSACLSLPLKSLRELARPYLRATPDCSGEVFGSWNS